MAKAQKSSLVIMTSSLLILTLAFPYANSEPYEDDDAPPYPPPTPVVPKPHKAADVVVEGMVYCQSCNYSGTWSLTEAEPLPGAQISVICRNYRNQISYYKAYTTNGGGYFYARLDKFVMRHNLLDHPLQSCAVKLVSSPDENCNVFTNVNYGIHGAPLRYEKKRIKRIGYEAVIYAAGPLAFRPDHCAPNDQY